MFAGCKLTVMLETNEVEHLYGEVFGPGIIDVIVETRPDDLDAWVAVCLEQFASGRLIDAIERFTEVGLIDAVDLAPHIDKLVRSIALNANPQHRWHDHILTAIGNGAAAAARLGATIDTTLAAQPPTSGYDWLVQLRVRLGGGLAEPRADADADDESEPAPISLLRSVASQPERRSLTASEGDFARELMSAKVDDRWGWWLASALFESIFTQDVEAANFHFTEALRLAPEHPQVLAEWAFYSDHVDKNIDEALRSYTHALANADAAPYELYPPVLSTMVQSPAYDHGRTLAKFAGFSAHRRNEFNEAHEYLEQALFVRRRIAANRAEIEPNHIVFLRQLVRVADHQAAVSTLYGFDEWSGPSLFELDI